MLLGLATTGPSINYIVSKSAISDPLPPLCCLSKVGNFWPPSLPPLLRRHSLWTAPTHLSNSHYQGRCICSRNDQDAHMIYYYGHFDYSGHFVLVIFPCIGPVWKLRCLCSYSPLTTTYRPPLQVLCVYESKLVLNCPSKVSEDTVRFQIVVCQE